MKTYLTLILFLVFSVAGFSQHFLEGLWQGTMTRGGIHAQNGYKFELYINVEGSQITGRSYVYINEEEVIEMDIVGKIYSDRSIYFEDIEFVTQQDSLFMPPFNRKYQLVYERSIWTNTMEGYWQEIRPDAFHRTRKRGRIILKKISGKKA